MFKKTTFKSSKGVATVEMAMVAPFIFLLVFGSVEFARMMMVRQSLTNAARHGCRKACLVTTTDSGDVHDSVRDSLQGVIQNASTNGDIRITTSPTFVASIAAGTSVTTTVEVDCSDVSWLPPFFTGSAKITGTSTMVRE